MKNLEVVASTLLLSFVFTTHVTAQTSAQKVADASAPPLRLETGAGHFIFSDAKGNADRPIEVWYYKPEDLQSDSPLLFVMHGSGRDSDRYLAEWIPYADAHSFLLVCPEFSKKHYPGSEMYNLGNMFTADGTPVDKSKWAYTAIEHLFDYLKNNVNLEHDTYSIYGHSAGGQFVHRFVLFVPEARIDAAVAANAGWYTMPTYELEFPYGLAGSGLGEEDFKRAFSKRLIVLLGNKDILMDEGLRKTTIVLQEQGISRMERGSRFLRFAHQEAARLETSLIWKRRIVQGAPHDNMQMARIAAPLLFGNGMNSEKTVLRSQYKTLGEGEVVSALKHHNLFDSQRNPFGEFANRYDAQTIQEDDVIVDEATGLMWHPTGSSNSMLLGEVGRWMDQFNADGYADYHDWRLPTLEEGASLLESGKLVGKYNIDPIFSSRQRYIWTGDSVGTSETAWIVFFRHGSVGKSFPLYVSYVRPVRSIQ